LRVRPVLDRPGADVAVERVVAERQRLSVTQHFRAVLEGRLGACARQLVGTLVEHRHAGSVNALHNPFGGEAGAGAGVEDREVFVVEPRGLERLRAHVGSPEQRVHPAVIAEREEAVEPIRLPLVLDQAHASGTIRR
jgi:hypothetical protein